MLVLSRKVGERLMIGEGIVVVVKRIAGQRVTFGIEAPADVRIVRGELKVFETPRSSGPDRNSGAESMPMLMSPVMPGDRNSEISACEAMSIKPR